MRQTVRIRRLSVGVALVPSFVFFLVFFVLIALNLTMLVGWVSWVVSPRWIDKGHRFELVMTLVIAVAGGLALIPAWWLFRRIRWKEIVSAEPLCPNCGYNLTGNVSGVCPECGRALDKPVDQVG